MDIQSLFSLEGRIALVTGGSRGIGRAIVEALLEREHHVFFCGRSPELLETTRRELDERHPGKVDAALCNVRAQEEVDALVARIEEQTGRLDVLVNNAGVHHRGSMLRHSPEQLAEMIMVNTAAPIALTRVAADVMEPGSVVVTVASLAGKLPLAGAATYSGSKAGVRFWAMAAAEDLAGRGIRVATVNPGPVDTGFLDEDLENVTAMTFSQPMSTVERVAQAVLEAIEADESPMEIDVPFASGKLATLGYVSPPLRRLLRPALEKRGAKVKAEFLRRKGLG